MTLTTFDRVVRSIHYAHEIAHGSPLSQTVERAQRAFEEPIEIVYEVEGGYIAQTATEAVFLGDDGEFALTDIHEAAKGKRDYRKEYDDYHAKPGQKKNRAARNAARASKGLAVGDKREVDHKVPLSKGGDNEDSNLRVVSRETNRSKGDSEESVDETISRSQLNSLERALDKLFAAANIDVEFTKHFMDRVNDARNVTDITIEELAGLFRETWKKFRKTLEKAKPNWNAILQDVSTAINIPIVMDVNKYGELELVAKTIMRKKAFTGRAKRLVVKSESMDEAFESMLDEAATLNVSNTPLDKARAYAEKTFEKAGKSLDEVIPDFDKNYTALQKVMKRALNIPRVQMPVIEPADMKTFLTRIKSGSLDILQPWAKGKLSTPTKLTKQEGKEWVQLGFKDGDEKDDKLSAKLTRMAANKLLPTQSQIWLEKLIENIVKFGVPSSSSPIAKATIIVSKEGFILDGHHRFGQAMLANPTLALSTLSVPLDIKLLLKVGRAYGEAIGNTVKEADVEEGINDKYILKAVFMTGGAGAGKSFISDLMFGGTGLKVVNSDTQLERAMKAAGLDLKKDMPSRQVQREGGLRDKARNITTKRLDLYVTTRLGLVIDSTAAKVQKVEKQVAMLRKLGYDCSMVFVNTSLETSLARNQARPRTVPEAVVKKDWNLVQTNLKKYRTLFGQKNFREIINDEVLSPKQVAARLTPQLTRIAMPMLNAPVTNPIGKKWMQDERARLGISPTGAVMPLAASHDSEDLLVEDMSVTELECLYVDEMSCALQTAIQQNPNDVHRVAHHFGEFERAVEEGEFEKAEMLYRSIVKALPLDAVTERSMSARHSQVSNVRRGTTKEIQSGKKNKGQVRSENRKRRIASRSKHKMTSSRVQRTRRSMSRASESGHSVQDVEQAILDEVSPPGWEKRVEKMKRDPDITNPWKLAWYLHNKQKKNESIEETLLNGQYRGIVDVKTRKVVFKGKSRGEVVRELKRLRGPVPKGGWDEQRGGFVPVASYRKEVGDKWTEALPNESVDEAKQSTEIMRVSTYPKPTPGDGYGGAVACSPGAHSNYLFYDDGTVVRETHAEGKTTRTLLGRAGKLGKKLREIRSVVRKHIGDDETITYSLTVQEGQAVDEDTNVHGIKFEERQLVSMYDDEDEATRGTFEDWRAKHFSQLDEGQAEYDKAFRVGWVAATAEFAVTGKPSRKTAEKAHKKSYKMHGHADFIEGYLAFIDAKAGAYAQAGPKRAKQMGLKESLDEASAAFKTLNDASVYDAGYAKGGTEIWYAASLGFHVLTMGLAFVRKHEPDKVPTLKNYKTSHKLLGKIAEKRPERIFGMMQGDLWSRAGEANTMLRRLGIHHTSMSVGDIIKIGNKVLFVDRDGFTPLS